MPNKNYLAGVRFERALRLALLDEGFDVLRAAGSHGKFDLIAFSPNTKTLLIQCKVVTSETAKRTLARKWLASPRKHLFYVETLAIKVKGSTEVTYVPERTNFLYA